MEIKREYRINCSVILCVQYKVEIYVTVDAGKSLLASGIIDCFGIPKQSLNILIYSILVEVVEGRLGAGKVVSR